MGGLLLNKADFWETIKRRYEGSDKFFVVNGMTYLESDDGVGPHYFTRHDGETVTVGKATCFGIVPEWYRAELPDNATLTK